jgi:hypothetical protein
MTTNQQSQLVEPTPKTSFKVPVVRNLIEYAGIVAWWLIAYALVHASWLGGNWMSAIIVLGCWTKTILFGVENLRQLYDAARCNLSHHRFLILMGVNMTQMVISFAFDFHLLHCIDNGCFAGIPKGIGQAEALFDFFYLSTLNFSFFGYSDILPQTVATKIVNLTEVVLAFVTVIFLLSDFISLKESLRDR